MIEGGAWLSVCRPAPPAFVPGYPVQIPTSVSHRLQDPSTQAMPSLVTACTTQDVWMQDLLANSQPASRNV